MLNFNNFKKFSKITFQITCSGKLLELSYVWIVYESIPYYVNFNSRDKIEHSLQIVQKVNEIQISICTEA